MPLGPPNLCAENDTTSVTVTMSRTSNQHAACTASLCSTAPFAEPRTTRATSRIGVMLPTSLFTAITDTTATRSPRDATLSNASCNSSTLMTPCLSTATITPPRCSTQWSTAWCSAALQTATPPWRRTAPKIAALSPSVPPLVNTTSPGAQPNTSATSSRASSIAVRADRENR